jgi:ABC-type glycerol-3-phosphate transport system substrate-binding protein
MRGIPKMPLFRVVSVALVVTASILVAACGSSDDDAGGGTITIWSAYAADSPHAKALKDLSDGYEAKHPGVTVKSVYVPYAQLPQKMIAAAPTGTGPDLIFHEGGTTDQLKEANAIRDMTKCVETWPTKQDLLPVARRVFGDATYSVLPYGHLVALWYNKALLDKYGLKPPKTIDQLEDAMDKVSGGGDIGLTFSANPTDEGPWSVMGLFTAYGVQYPHMNTPATPTVFARLASWADKGWVPRSVSSMSQGDAFQRFLGGNVAFTITGNWEVQHAEDAVKFPYGVITMPRGSHPARVYISGENAMIGKFSKDPERVCDYLRTTWFSKAGQERLAETGSLPILQSVVKSHPSFSNDPVRQAFVEQSKTALEYPGGKGYDGLVKAWSPALSAMMAGRKTADEASEETITGVEEIVGGSDER